MKEEVRLFASSIYMKLNNKGRNKIMLLKSVKGLYDTGLLETKTIDDFDNLYLMPDYEKIKKESLLANNKLSGLKIIYASKKEVEEANKKCLKKYHDVFKELAKR